MSISPSPAASWRALAACLLVSPLIAAVHDDDPKVLDREAPRNGPGFRTALPADGIPLTQSQFQQSLGFPSSNVTLLSQVPLSQIDGANSGNDCWGYTSPSGREYAIIGTSSGTGFYDISDPGNPVDVGYIDGPDSLWRDMKVFGTRCYITSEGGGGIQVVNMANIDSGSVNLSNTISSGGSTQTHNVVINEDSGYLYRTGGGTNLGLRVYDLNANPNNPPFVASWTTKYVHDAQVVTYDSGPFAGREIAFCCSGFGNGSTNTGFTIIDVSNKSNLQVLDEVFYPNPAYSHQGWLSNDKQRFYLGDELDEDGSLDTTTWVINVSNINNAFVETSFTNGNNAVGHNMYERDGLLYQANYTSGLRVFDIASNPTNPAEVAFFDTRPEDDNASFNGLWSCYPYFESGVVIGSDLESGLFVWFAGEPQLDIQLVAGEPAQLDPDGETLAVTIEPTGTASIAPGTETLWYDSGTGFVSVPLTPTGGNGYNAVFPPIACGSTVNWYVAAESDTGLLWTAPASAPLTAFSTLSAEGVTTLVSYNMQQDEGWSSGAPGDNANTGIWERGNPVGTSAQPEDDNSPIGGRCWFTGQGAAGGGLGDNDVDGGVTTLLSPTIDLSSTSEPVISYFRWYSNDQGASPNADVFEIDITANGGSTWVTVEDVGPAGPGTSGGWIQNTFRVADFVNDTGSIQMRFRASDLGTGSIVEAAIDDFRVDSVDCDENLFTSYCSPAVPNSTGFPAVMSATGSNVVSDNNLVISGSGVPINQFGICLTSQTQGNTPMAGGSQGTLCLGGTIARFGVVNSGPTGVFTQVVDLTSLPFTPMVAAQPGETYNFQAWFRDLNPGATSNFTDGITITFQ